MRCYMSREIKFRAWEKRYGEMKRPHDLYISGQGDEALSAYIHDRYVFMQYTGLKDKNGVEIYDGDIVKFRRHPARLSAVKVGEVRYSDQGAKFYVAWFDNELERERNYPSTTDMNLRSIEVIGNIHENPELLEEN